MAHLINAVPYEDLRRAFLVPVQNVTNVESKPSNHAYILFSDSGQPVVIELLSLGQGRICLQQYAHGLALCCNSAAVAPRGKLNLVHCRSDGGVGLEGLREDEECSRGFNNNKSVIR